MLASLDLLRARLLCVSCEPGFRLLDLWQVRVGVLPACQEILVSLNRFRRIAGQCIGPGNAVQSVAALGPLLQRLLEGVASLVPLMGFQICVSEAFLFRTVKVRWFGVAEVLLVFKGFLEKLQGFPAFSLKAFNVGAQIE